MLVAMFRAKRRLGALLAGAALFLTGGSALGQHTTASTTSDREQPGLIEASKLPPPSHVIYFQYGVAFTTEQVVAPGPMCGSVVVPCILGSGGGIAVRAGYRSTGPFYVGGAYEVTKQDASKLYRMALLQQARAEARYYIDTARVTQPYITAGLGVSGYGNEWSIDTGGPTGSLGAGVEVQLTRRTVVGLALHYRVLYFGRFLDTAGSERAPGLSQVFGVDLVLEQRDAFRRSGEPQ